MQDFYNSIDSAAVKGRFYVKDVIHSLESKKKGKPVYIQKIYVEIVINKMDDNFQAPATDAHKARFPDAWKAFNAENKDAVEATAPVADKPEYTVLPKGRGWFDVIGLDQVPVNDSSLREDAAQELADRLNND